MAFWFQPKILILAWGHAGCGSWTWPLTSFLWGSEAGVRSALCLRSPIQARQRAGFPNPVHVAHMGAAQRPHGAAPRPSSEPVTQGRMHSEEMERTGSPGPRDPLAQGVHSGILNLPLGAWGRDPKEGLGRRSPALISAPRAHRRPLWPAAWVRRARPWGSVEGAGCGDLLRGWAGRHLHDATATGTMPQSVCGRQTPPLRGAYVRRFRGGCRDL